MRTLSLLIAIFFLSNTANAQLSGTDSVPVRLSTLEATTKGSDAVLDWEVVCFLEYAKFEIQRSSNGINYTIINTFEADRLRCKQPFDFTDAGITGKTFYRIRVGDIDGKFYSSKVVAVTGKDKGFEINSITPSLVTSNATLSISSAAIDKAEAVITNFQGAVIRRLKINLNKGVTEVPIDAIGLAKGNYILTVTNGFSKVKSTKFTKL
jgi:hypothetical protein